MPTNLTPEYFVAEQEYHKAKTRGEKIKALEKMISVAPKHKGSEKLLGELKRKISKLRKEIQADVKRRKAFAKKGIRKEGAAQVVLIGLPNSGKSYLLNKLCGTRLKSTALPFETVKPEVGMLEVHGVQLQIIEIPSLYPGFYEKRGEFRGMINAADAIAILIKDKSELEFIKREIELNEKIFVIGNSKELEKFKTDLWTKLNLIKVYTKEPGKKMEKKPVALKINATVEDLGKEIHKEFIQRFKYAKVIRLKDKVKERQAGLKFILEDGDIVEFHIN